MSFIENELNINKKEIEQEIKADYEKQGIDYTQALVDEAVMVSCLQSLLGKLEDYKELHIAYDGGFKDYIFDANEFDMLAEELEHYYDSLVEFPENLERDNFDEEHPDLISTVATHCSESPYVNRKDLYEQLCNEVEHGIDPEDEDDALYGTGNTKEFDIAKLIKIEECYVEYLCELVSQLDSRI
ncbi:hypothetical protein [Pseudoalteromonas sp. SR45-5]|jgi:hypothetical protein|uniref:hypothetical protein n=1 Tax=Pseudoalteromonas sp. SR45-5 TaxID=2760928 RepID=UPI0015F8E4F3|nr:hypothetical protein [Pseudoalteromonas sp. SR45-5]MBB1353053.1 hypothetical protein [Pseudoalteromonas sp. SR45-5]